MSPRDARHLVAALAVTGLLIRLYDVVADEMAALALPACCSYLRHRLASASTAGELEVGTPSAAALY